MNFLTLGDYGLIGNQVSAALVSRLGSIDWCCLPYLDSPSHFAALLDAGQGGRFQLVPLGDFRSEQRYLHRTHVLETIFETPHGRAILTDWMPIDDGCVQDPTIHRKLSMISGRIQWLAICLPRFGYGATAARAERFRGDLLFRGARPGELAQLVSTRSLEISEDGQCATGRFTLEAPDTAQFVWAWGRRAIRPGFVEPFATIEWWRSGAHRCPGQPTGCAFSGPCHDAVVRAGLVLKLLMAPYSGAIAEAATTSVPCQPGGSHTWDLRYSWLRDAGMTLKALSGLGYREEARAYFGWICDLLERDGAEGLQPVYTLDGGRELPEQELTHLAGYRQSRPVRVGNQSAHRFQLGIYGHVMLAAMEHYETFGNLPERVIPRLWEVADFVSQAWRRPDHGPWEIRAKPEHYVASKVLCWAALDRACSLAKALHRPAPPRWTQERDVLHRTICQQGFDERQSSFVRAFSDRELDTATMIIPLVRFLPPEDSRVQGTLRALQTQLSEGALFHRYRANDDLPGSENAHLCSSFAFASCLALSGRPDEADDRLVELCAYASPLGLFAEQLDPKSGESRGNFPSASVHIALINASLSIAYTRGRQGNLRSLSRRSA